MQKIPPDTKCLLTTNDKDCFLVVTFQNDNLNFSRLPLFSEISTSIIDGNQLVFKKEVVILTTENDTSPWVLFEPFPPANNYGDYGYITFFDKQGFNRSFNANGKEELYSLWDILSLEEKKLVEKFESQLDF